MNLWKVKITELNEKLTAAEARLAVQEMKLNWCKSQRNLYLEGLAEKLGLPDTELREKIKKCDQELEQLTKESKWKKNQFYLTAKWSGQFLRGAIRESKWKKFLIIIPQRCLLNKIRNLIDLLVEKIKQDPDLKIALHEATYELDALNPLQKLQALQILKNGLEKVGLKLWKKI